MFSSIFLLKVFQHSVVQWLVLGLIVLVTTYLSMHTCLDVDYIY